MPLRPSIPPMAQPNALVEIAEVKEALGITDASEDVFLDLAIDSASNWIERQTNRYFIQRSRVEKHRGGMKNMHLDRYPIISVASIVDPAANVVLSTDYYIDSAHGVLQHWGRFPIAQAPSGFPAEWTVTYTAGLWSAQAAIEGDIRLACIRLVSLAREQKSGGVSSVSVGSLSVSYASLEGGQPMPPEILSVISTYKQVSP